MGGGGMLKQLGWDESWCVRHEMQHAVVELHPISPANKSNREMIQLEQKGAPPTCMQCVSLCAAGWQASKGI